MKHDVTNIESPFLKILSILVINKKIYLKILELYPIKLPEIIDSVIQNWFWKKDFMMERDLLISKILEMCHFKTSSRIIHKCIGFERETCSIIFHNSFRRVMKYHKNYIEKQTFYSLDVFFLSI